MEYQLLNYNTEYNSNKRYKYYFWTLAVIVICSVSHVSKTSCHRLHVADISAQAGPHGYQTASPATYQRRQPVSKRRLWMGGVGAGGTYDDAQGPTKQSCLRQLPQSKHSILV
jgi:hypothetical protein